MSDLIHAVLNPAVIGTLIPLSAVVGAFYIAALKIKARQAKGLGKEDKEMLIGIMKDNQQLQERVSNLESIITGLDQELIDLKGPGYDSLGPQKKEFIK